MFRYTLLLTVASLAALSFPAFADDDAATVPTIVVTPTVGSPVPLNQIASSMTVIDHQEIERQNKATVTELLEEVPGLSIANSGGTGQSTRVFLRGTNSNHVLVLIDGVAVNDPSDPADAFDFSNLTTTNIERIEILRGPQSTLYGSEALGGVINIITKKGSGTPTYTAFAEYGRYNTSREGLGTTGAVGRTSYGLEASYGHTDGISAFDKRYGGHEKDGDDATTFSGRVESKLTDNFTLKFNGRYNRSVADFDSVGSLGIGGTRPNDDPLPNGDSRQINARVAGELTLLDGRWVQELGVSAVNFDRDLTAEYFDSSFNPHFGAQQYKGERNTINWVHHLKLVPDHLVTVGVEDSTEFFKKNSPIEGLPNVDDENKAIFADDQYTITRNAFVNYGVRLDDNESFGRQFTWKVAPGYHIISTDTLLKMTYGTGFKAPSLEQLFDPTAGNPLLGPERSKGWDAGFEQTLLNGKAVFGATVFRNDITDLIGFGPAPLFATLNVGKARTEGVESSLTLHPTLDWNIAASHTYTLSEDRTHDTELLRRPKHLGTLSSTYQYNAAGDVGVNVRYVGLSRDYDFPTSSFVKDMKAFTTVNLTANYKIDHGLTLYSHLDNLLNKRYEEIDGFGEPGMSLTVGAKANF